MKTVFGVVTDVEGRCLTLGIFSSDEKAWAAAELFNDAEVIEWPLDPFVEAMDSGLFPWSVSMDADGTVTYCAPCEEWECPIEERLELIGKGDDVEIEAKVMAEGWERAQEIVEEFRQREIDEGRL